MPGHRIVLWMRTRRQGFSAVAMHQKQEGAYPSAKAPMIWVRRTVITHPAGACHSAEERPRRNW